MRKAVGGPMTRIKYLLDVGPHSMHKDYSRKKFTGKVGFFYLFGGGGISMC